MTKKLSKVVLAALLSLCLLLAAAVLLIPAATKASADETQLVTLSEESDFEIEGGVLSGLSDGAKSKIAAAAGYSVVVPDTVTEITEGAFAGLGGMTSLTVPFVGKSATATGGDAVLGYVFGKQAFIGAALTNQVYDSNENAKQIERGIYVPSFVTNRQYPAYIPNDLEEVIVKGGTISHGAFSSCKFLQKVTLADSITTVGDLAFYNSNVREVNLGKVTTICRRAFQGAANLRTVDLSSIESLGNHAFAMCGLYSVELPESLGAGMGAFAFYNCTSLVKVTVAQGVTLTLAKSYDNGPDFSPFIYSYRICEVFDYREEGVDKSPDFWNNQWSYMTGVATVVKTEEGVSDLAVVNDYVFVKRTDENNSDYWRLFEYLGTDKVLKLPDAQDFADNGVNIPCYTLASMAFQYENKNFATLEIPDCVYYIPYNAFANSGLVKITVGEPKEEGNEYAEIRYEWRSFWNCTSLKELFIFSKWQYTYNDTIYDPDFGYTVYLLDDDGNYIYNSETGTYETKDIKLSGVHYYHVASGAEIPKSTVNAIGDYLFNMGDSIELMAYLGNGGIISLPGESAVGGQYKINDSVFAGNERIKGVIIPEAVTEIGSFAFKECPVLVNVSIEGNNLKKIGQEVFKHSYALNAISIPDSVTHIGTAAFSDCTSLSVVHLPASLTTWGTEQLLGGSSTDKGYVFFNCIKLTSVTIPASATYIPLNAFYGCSALTSLTFAEDSKVETIGANAFVGAALTSVVLPASVKTVETMAFGNMTTIKQLYLEGGNVAFATAGSFTEYGVKFESVYIAEMGDTLTLGKAYNFENDSTAFIPTGANAALVKQVSKAKTIVVPDKATYDALMADSAVEAGIKSKLFWQTEITFTVTDTLGNTYTEKQNKLARDGGASIKYVLSYDSEGRPYNWAVNEAYSLPSVVGGNLVDSADWLDGADPLTTDATISEAGVTYTMAEAVEAKITTPSDKRIEYTGEVFTVTEATLTYVRATDRVGNTVTPVDAGEYTVYVKPATGVVWENGGTEERSFTLEIQKATTTLQWKYNIAEDIDSSGVYEITYFEELRVALFSAAFGEVTLTTAEGITVAKDGQLPSALSIMSEGMYRFTAAHENYEFTNSEIMVRVLPIEIDLVDDGALTWSASNTDPLRIIDGDVFIGTVGDKTVLHTFQQPNVSYTERRAVVNSIVRYTGKETVLTLSDSSNYTFTITGNERTESGIYTATATLTVNENYKFITVDFENNSFAARGMTVTISPNGKTAVVTKVWYIIELENELLDEAASKEAGDWKEYGIVSWTYGDDVTISVPRLAHGDEDENWKENGNVTFELILNDVTIIRSGFTRSQLAYYVNKSMPAGRYTLIATVSTGSLGGAHTHWWNDEAHDNTDSGLLAQDFERRYYFTVDAATIALDTTKLTLGENGYEDYLWEITASVNKESFFEKFANKVADGVVTLTSVTRSGYWGTEAADEYYGEYELTYNLARMNNERYLASNSNDLLSFISNDLPGTYTVYFQITAPNHNNLTDIGVEGRYAYYFTVVTYKTIDIPTVIDAGLVYTGSKVLPEIVESELYETVWSDTDEYIVGGKHTVWFKLYDNVHYRWKGEDGDTVSADFTVAKAANAWTRDPNIVNWTFETFDTQTNRLYAVAKFLDAGQSIKFTITKADGTAVAGLESFTMKDNGMTDDAQLIKALNGLSTGAYKLKVAVAETGNYLALNASLDFNIGKTPNSWADGEDDLVLPSWIVGQYNEEENIIVINAAHGTVNIIITDLDGNEYYRRINGVVELDNLNDCEIGKYLVKAWVDETDDYSELPERTFTIEVFKKAGLPWWAVLLIVIGSLGVAALILWILHEKGVLQMLTGKIVVAIRTKMTVDATIAAVRANKRAEESRKSIAKAEAQDRLEAMRKKAAEQRALPPEERAAALEERAAVEAARAEKAQQRADRLQNRADKLKGNDTVETPATIEAEPVETDGATEGSADPTDEE